MITGYGFIENNKHFFFGMFISPIINEILRTTSYLEDLKFMVECQRENKANNVQRSACLCT